MDNVDRQSVAAMEAAVQRFAPETKAVGSLITQLILLLRDNPARASFQMPRFNQLRRVPDIVREATALSFRAGGDLARNFAAEWRALTTDMYDVLGEMTIGDVSHWRTLLVLQWLRSLWNVLDNAGVYWVHTMRR